MWWRRHQAAATGSVDRLVELYNRYGGTVYARCRQILSDEAAAEDATQETFLRAKRQLDSKGEPTNPLGWLFTVATNYCLNEIRNGKNRAQPSDTIEATDDRLQAALDDRDLAARLVERADPQVRVAAWLCHVDGMTQEEAAKLLGVSRRTVVNWLSRLSRESEEFLRRSEG
jgi:RNA polymerase sigma-70 factor (ECF subfamily)